MAKAGLTEILCVIDKSGSMASLASDVIGGFNQFLKDQKECPGEARLTLMLFDTSYNMKYKSEPIENVKDFDSICYNPGGCTALLDAIGKTITEAGALFDTRSDDEKPEKVVCLIMTDGQENSSKEHTREAIKQMIERQTKEWGWEFVFIGANQDSFTEAGSIGIVASNTANFSATRQSVKAAYSGMSANLCAYRTSEKTDMNLGTDKY